MFHRWDTPPEDYEIDDDDRDEAYYDDGYWDYLSDIDNWYDQFIDTDDE